MQNLFELVREKNIKVCTISPGFVATEMVSPFFNDTSTLIKVEDIAETVSFVVRVRDFFVSFFLPC